MPLLTGHRQNFETLQTAFINGDVALMECQSRVTGEPVAVICAVNRQPEGDFEFVPFGLMIDGNPYEMLNPPAPAGGFHCQEDRK